LKIWDYEQEKDIATLEGHSECVNTVAHILNTKLVASGSWDKTIKTWNYETGVCVNTLIGHSDGVMTVVVL
jgi:WD40 repeat protein